jgi:hypothetical protein
LPNALHIRRHLSVQSLRRPMNAEVPLAEVIFSPQWTACAVASLHLWDFIALTYGAEKPSFQTILSERRAATTDALRHVFVCVRNFHFVVTSRMLLQL